ncbi:MAG TPA: UDP-N-acetylmuramate:L-alanyl-gamma-D-glutamyl-meso-diaminopimelate ligase [Desulfatiglandales bacterium]|nr:UDP-N-acetylmuramate:L-alanyl-gamma-D-glutamyl-meso-diaminopimelate ligase [Desulfatiglandales bacterium]
MHTENIKTTDLPLLSPDLNIIPPDPKRIHLMGICGTGMASLAGILKHKGYSVTGSDENIYPPMSNFLESLSIPFFKGYSPENLAFMPDMVIVGNVITRHNPEAIRLSQAHIPYVSFPQALGHFAMKDKRSIVVCGTHGKTTTSALASWVLEKAGMDPGFMIGGILNNFQSNFKLGEGPDFVIEGDEYDTAFFDKGPKFLHYNPWITILTGIEFDHADIYRDLEHFIESFRRLIDRIPPDGLLIYNLDDPIVTAEVKMARCPVISYGLNTDGNWKAVDIALRDGLTQLKILRDGNEYASLMTSLYGLYNISNLLGVAALSEQMGIDVSTLSKAAITFMGVKRRQEIRGEKGGVLILDDFAHHPTAVEKTIQAVKDRYKGRRLIAVFEPRSNSSRRNVFQKRYGLSFDKADLIFIPEPPMMEKIPVGERFSSMELVSSLNRRDLKAFYCPDHDNLLGEILKRVHRDDVILIMSNGPFDNIHDRLLERL